MANEQWKDDISYAMTPFKLISWPLGVWPLQVYNFYSLLRSILSFCFLVLVLILPLIELCMGCNSAEENVDCIMLSFCGMLGILKITWFRIYANNLISNYKSALNDYLTIENVEERIIMRKHALAARIVSFPMLIFAYFMCIIYTIIPFMNYGDKNQNITDEKILEYPLPSKCTMKYFHAPISMYKIFVIIQAISIAVMINANHGNDGLFINITLHVCGQMKILRARFASVDITCPQIYDRFNKLLQRHINLIRMIRKLADVISFILLTELFVLSICLCIMGFQFIIALKDKNSVMIAQSLMAQIICLVKLSMYSFIGNYLQIQMEDIGYFIYQSAWYEFPIKLSKNLVFILMQTQAPAMFQAGNFIEVNLSTLVNILKTSFSYLSVLRIMLDT
ncbi:odorant receptor 13a-like [Cataglyphis hispanica]|uniref:odorant receptor 13a-like n=1 Tax=Cataglyphis hispanica TaxID=1086592 RepID=UPI00217FD79C|nr:odorant receptor 13a-like [Cataglyphis hispanica]